MPDNAAVQEALERIVASGGFANSPRMSRFLRFVVEETVSGRAGDLKEYVVGLRVFDRPESFDPTVDPTVRVEASKLRAKLTRYYETEGRRDSLTIAIPKGHYRATFSTQEGAEHCQPSAVEASPASPAAFREIVQLDTFPEPGLNDARDGPEYLGRFPKRNNRSPTIVIERSDTRPPIAAPVVQRARRPFRWLIPILTGTGVLAAAISVWVVWRAPSPGANLRIQVVTALPGLEQFPSISPDGSFVVFSWTGPNAEGVPDLWIKAVDSDDSRRLTDTPASELRPAWSPDGREIAFLRAGQGVFITSVLGGQERKVGGSGTIVGWTPDGHSLLVRDRTANTSFGIFRIDLDTGKRLPLTQAPSGIGDYTFSSSPDGRTLAFVRYGRPGVADIYSMPLAGGDARRLTNWNSSISGVAWTADGRHLLYSVDEQTGLEQSLFMIRADSERLDRGLRIHTNIANPSLSRSGPGQPARLAFTAGRIDVGLRLVDLESVDTQFTFGNIRKFSDSTRVDTPGRYSRDGRKVAFSSSRTGSGEVWVADADGTAARQVTALQATELIIGEWSPDDRRIVIDAAIAGNSDVYVVSLEGGPPVQLTREPGLDALAGWSADGRWIYFSSDRSGSLQVWKVPSAGGDAVQVTHQGGLEPQEATDGRTLFYLDRPPPGPGGISGRGTIKQVPVEGGPEVVVLENARFRLWSVTNDGIIFLTIERESDEIHRYSFSDRRVRRLGKLPFRVSRIAGLGGLVASRDGRWFLVSATDYWESDIMVADGLR